MKVGVIDDDDGMRDSLGALLRAYGFDILLFDSAEAVIADVDTLHGISVLIVDQHLPGLSGLDFIRRIAGRHIVTVLISAQMDERLKADALAAGVMAALGKPLDLAILLAAINGGGAARVPL